MASPSLLVPDEPSLGLAPLIVRDIFEVIQRINKNGVSVQMVEQNIRLALEVSDFAYILENGRIVGDGTGQQLLRDNRLVEAYLGA